MKTNYDNLTEHNATLAKQCIAADAFVKTFPEKAASLYGKAVNTFLAVICCNNDIAFDRTKDLTLINMIGAAYSYGVISKYEKGVLDDMRYAAYLADNPRIAGKTIDTKTLIEKVISFFGMVMRYYHLENEQYSEDNLPIGDCEVISVMKSFEMDTAYDKVYLASEEGGGYAIVAQYVLHHSEISDEVFSYLAEEDLKRRFTSCRTVLRPEVIPHQPGNNIICVKTSVPEGYVSLSFDDISNLYTEQRLKLIVNLAKVIFDLHSSERPIALGGFEPSDIWISYKGLKCVISGLESKIKSCVNTESNIKADIKSFAYIAASLLPEYEKIPTAGLLIKHVLMGSGKSNMDRIYPILKKEVAHFAFESVQLNEVLDRPSSEFYEALKNGLLEIKEEKEKFNENKAEEKQEEPLAEEVDFDEMYSKVFND
ncbi:MAG: hypothetical protein Q4G23_02175 [Clostridia bacterium]|nr:hypothetical protein [Clostridia bacterium]